MKWFLPIVLGASVASAGIATTTSEAMMTTPMAPTTMMTTTAAAPTPALMDKFTVHALRAMRNGWQVDIDFTVMDHSTWPVQETKCHINWHGLHTRRGPVKCDDGWFTAAVTYWDDPQSFGLNINHAYGEGCIGCNDEEDEEFQGEVGTCTLQLDEDKMTSLEGDESHWHSVALRDLNCYVDFDDE